MNDQPFIQAARDAAFTLRDHFAAAALPLCTRNFRTAEQIAESAYKLADAMLRERANTSVGASGAVPVADRKSVAAHGACARSCSQPFDSAPTADQERFIRFQSAVMNWISEATGFFHDDVLRTDDARDVITDACSRCWDAFDRISYPTTNHDAAPAARAEESMKEPNGSSTGEPGGEPESTVRTGKTNQSASACDGADVPSTPNSGGPINRAAHGGQSPDGTGESERRDVPRPDTKGKAAGGPAHHILEAEIDALEFVVEEGRIANIEDYGILRQLLIRLRQEWEFSDSPKPIKDAGSDRSEPIAPTMLVNGVGRPVSYAKSYEKRVLCDTKNPRNGALSGRETAPDPDSRVWETPCTPQPHATPTQGSEPRECTKPTLTDAEREAVEIAADLIDNKTCGDSSTLRGLLERLA